MAISRTAAGLDASIDTPVLTERQHAASDLLLVCEHASNRVPIRYRGLGLSRDALNTHIAWDPGALQLARHLSVTLDAALVHATVSRLVYDCNRPPDAPSAMPEMSEGKRIPGNTSLDRTERDERTRSIYVPFHAAVDAQCHRLAQRAGTPVIVTIHTFTPVYLGRRRDVEIGILHDSDRRLADAMLALASDYTSLDTRQNEPYGPDDGVTHSLKRHALTRGWLNVMLEVRNDLLQSSIGIETIGRLFSGWIPAAVTLANDNTDGRQFSMVTP